MDALIRDLHHGVRTLLKQRAYTSVVSLTLGLALGVNTLIFSFADFFLLRPLPIRDMPAQVLLYTTHPERGVERVPASYQDYLEWQKARSFEGLAAMRGETETLTGLGEPRRLQAERASASLFSTWGLEAVMGRVLQPDDDRPGAVPVAVLSHRFWQRELGSDARVVGRSLLLNGQPHTVVGVLTPEIELGTLGLIDVWLPLAPVANLDGGTQRDLRVLGRLRSGVTLQQAAAEMDAIGRRQQLEHPSTHAGWGARVITLRRGMTGVNSVMAMTLLGLAVAFVLAIACANVANLNLARAVARERELAVQLALGATRLVIVRRLLLEGLLVATLGGGLGVMVAAWGLSLIRSAAYEPFFKQVVIDWRVLSFAGLLTIVTPVLFALAPALRAAGADVAGALREGAGRGSVGYAHARGRDALVVIQLGLALALLVVAGLTVRSALAVQRLNLGFNVANVTMLRLDLPPARYRTPEQIGFVVDRVRTALASAPGARHAGVGSGVPVLDAPASDALAIEGASESPGHVPTTARVIVDTGYFDALQLPIVSGRGFEHGDGPGAEPVAVVSRSLAARYFHDREPLGLRIRLGSQESGAPWRTIVGVAGDVQNAFPGEPPLPIVYLPLAQDAARSLVLFVRTPDAGAAVAAVRAELARVDPEQPIYDAETLVQAFDDQLASDRIITGLFVSLAGVALVLAIVGLYGVIAYSVSQRTREFGVRVALGASRADVVRLVIAKGLRLTLLGLLLGLAAGIAMARAIASALYGVTATDPATFSVVTLALLVTAAIASVAPAWRVARMDPIQALREG